VFGSPIDAALYGFAPHKVHAIREQIAEQRFVILKTYHSADYPGVCVQRFARLFAPRRVFALLFAG
jgi:hypothetical protein